MKKFILCLLLCTLCIFAGCAPDKQPAFTFTPSPTATSSTENMVLVENITFRRGENADGEILLTSEDLEQVSIGQNVVEGDSLLFTFTESGKQRLAQYTTEFSQSDETISIWIGEEQISCVTVSEPIYDGKILLAGSLSLDEITSFYNKCYDLVPTNLPTETNINLKAIDGSFLLEADGWVYYRNEVGNICRMQPDGTEKYEYKNTWESGSSEYKKYIYVVKDWIFYFESDNVYKKMKTDDTERTELLKDAYHFDDVYVGENYIVYEDYTIHESIYRTDLNGENAVSIGKYLYGPNEMLIQENWLYFIQGKDHALFRFDLKNLQEGSLPTPDEDKFELFFGTPFFLKDWIYIGNQRIRVDGTQKEKFLSGDYAEVKAIIGDWILYEDGNQIYKIKEDGTQNTLLYQCDEEGWYINMLMSAGNWILFEKYEINADGEEGAVFAITIDGTEVEEYNYPVIMPYPRGWRWSERFWQVAQ